ncbi:MAG: NAD(P)/FAD-dependent oxidoreductase [Gammaproteobacteria bacterium]|nr:NAD(P)/FAD-dependent oxidoreductase [Gammaproteobacteria bacterium]NNF49742.1 NAD(P)/FAD-dependent oxidoreductase [Woeseiaceae bacterium]MBT8094146.1 NAD(P)/FAD-dependent oxidoreductase [Gammaproteobacteria bacterium]MBT8106539.1 NAD(P)/FAD-dependent oxidoreductase [Gammaproteobacteria bacterium]NNK26554.1 NAD(P)/FAD-dependent oxidoreductase [Woeseiaceae bacterium]
MRTYDAIVVGAGHNGLTTAAFLAKAGLDVVCVEKNDYIGGAAVSRNLYQDWIYSNCSYVCSLLRPEIFRALELHKHGLQITPFGGSVQFMENGDYFGAYHDPEVAYRELARFSRRDADNYKTYRADTMRQCRFIRDFLLNTAPDPTSFKPGDLRELLEIGGKFAEMGEDRMYETIRFWTMSVADYLDEYFETEVIKAAKAGSGIIGTALGVYSPGTAYVLLHHYMGEVDGNVGSWGFARGGMGAVSNAIAGAFQAAGGELRTEAGVDTIIVKNGKATGVALENGDEIDGRLVVSAMDVKRTFLKCVERSELPDQFVHRVENFKIRGSSGKLNIALDGLPTFPALPEGSSLINSDMHFIDSLERMERAYDDWKAGTWSKDPYVDMVIPTLSDPTMAPPGKHFMSCFVQYCPHQVEGRAWTSEEKDAFGRTVIDQIANYSPDFRDLILHVEVRTPEDIENEIGITEGNIFHGELTMDQLLFNRPIPGFAQYRSPVDGLYMCGSSTHPGGGVMAAPGANAAREILADLGRQNTVPENFGDD